MIEGGSAPPITEVPAITMPRLRPRRSELDALATALCRIGIAGPSQKPMTRRSSSITP